MAFTLGFHIILVPFGVAFTAIMLIAEYRGIRRGDQQAMVLAFEKLFMITGIAFLCVLPLVLFLRTPERAEKIEVHMEM